jgi:hypothetical protein
MYIYIHLNGSPIVRGCPIPTRRLTGTAQVEDSEVRGYGETIPQWRPDLATDKEDRRILLVEIAVYSDAKVLRRKGRGNAPKIYQALPNDLAAAQQGYRVSVIRTVVGTLGNLISVNKEVKQLSWSRVK